MGGGPRPHCSGARSNPLPLLPSGPDGVRGRSSRRCEREPPWTGCKHGGEGGIRTLEHLLGCYSLSRRAPSTTRPPLRRIAHSSAHLDLRGRKGTVWASHGAIEAPQLIASRPSSRLRFHWHGGLVFWRIFQTRIARAARRDHDIRGDRWNRQRRGRVGRIQARGNLKRRHLLGVTILLIGVAAGFAAQVMTPAGRRQKGRENHHSSQIHAA